MSFEFKEKKLIETKTVVVEEEIENLCGLRDHYKKDIEYFTDKLAEVEAKIKEAKKLGFKEQN